MLLGQPIILQVAVLPVKKCRILVAAEKDHLVVPFAIAPLGDVCLVEVAGVSNLWTNLPPNWVWRCQ